MLGFLPMLGFLTDGQTVALGFVVILVVSFLNGAMDNDGRDLLDRLLECQVMLKYQVEDEQHAKAEKSKAPTAKRSTSSARGRVSTIDDAKVKAQAEIRSRQEAAAARCARTRHTVQFPLENQLHLLSKGS